MGVRVFDFVDPTASSVDGAKRDPSVSEYRNRGPRNGSDERNDSNERGMRRRIDPTVQWLISPWPARRDVELLADDGEAVVFAYFEVGRHSHARAGFE